LVDAVRLTLAAAGERTGRASYDDHGVAASPGNTGDLPVVDVDEAR
jgi:hypothetical protein